MGKFLIGTASWTDKTLIDSGAFYPKSARSAEDRLRFYAESFPIVEVDSTYYFPPTEKNAVLWMERTPAHFTFHIKAYSLITQHPTRPKSLYPDLLKQIEEENRSQKSLYISHLSASAIDEVWKRFADALMPLHSSGKLGVVHFQFPEWFLPGSRSRDYILECKQRLPDYRIAVELRNATWYNPSNLERTMAFFAENAIPVTSVDMPQGFRSSLPPQPFSTAKDLAYVRFHGRNTENWEKKHATATPRFAYLYDQEELKEWVPKLNDLSETTEEVHVLMNNCYRDYAQRNARELADLLKEQDT
ncbi:MAG TPA: DUF72 domain-containing protein [Actinomycetota bacterium]|nr:DUF72 domain-containing protein [Actinomycetota bacterium]